MMNDEAKLHDLRDFRKYAPDVAHAVKAPARWRRLDPENTSCPTWLTVFSYYDFKSEVRLSFEPNEQGERRWTVRAVKIASSRRTSGPAWLRQRLNDKEAGLLWQHFVGPLSVMRDALPDEAEARVWREVM